MLFPALHFHSNAPCAASLLQFQGDDTLVPRSVISPPSSRASYLYYMYSYTTYEVYILDHIIPA